MGLFSMFARLAFRTSTRSASFVRSASTLTPKIAPVAVRAKYASFGAAAAAAVTAASIAIVSNEKQSFCEEALPVYGIPGTNQERTFLAVKPDGVQRGLIGDIISRFEKRGAM